MKFLKKLYWNLILRYIVFLLTTVIATSIFLVGTVFFILYTSSGYFALHSEVEDAIKEEVIPIRSIEYDNRTKNLKLSDPIGKDTWVEIIKDNEVIFVKGNKQDNKMSYTQDELAIISNNLDELIPPNNVSLERNPDNISYEYIPFKGLDGDNYICLFKKPRGKVKFEFGVIVPDSLKGTKFEKEIKMKTNALFWIFVFSIICIILLFSRLTSKKIIKPLKELNKGFQNVIRGNYSEKLDFKGSYEFEQLRDNFNYMVEKLKKAESENKRLSESKKRLLLDISHDLRTPATTIQGYAQAIANDLVDGEEKKKKYLSYIYEKSKLVTKLIETLFKYSKLESSVYDLNKEVDNLTEFLRNIIINFYGELDRKGFNLCIKIPNKKILYNFDKTELERALYNIIDNTIKYNPKNTTLTVQLEDYGDYIEVIIEDNGIGISENVQEDIFNALVRGDNSRKTDGGMGLGLAIAKKIIELHGGHISLESKIGKGTKFFIKLKK